MPTVNGLRGFGAQLRIMGHEPFAWPAPNGYPDALGAWGSNLLPRWAFASRLLGNEVQGARVPNTSLGALYGGAAPNARAAALDLALTGGRMSAVDVQEVQQFIDGQPVFNVSVAREAVALALSLPSTQWI